VADAGRAAGFHLGAHLLTDENSGGISAEPQRFTRA
jgi:hypothetical protein